MTPPFIIRYVDPATAANPGDWNWGQSLGSFLAGEPAIEENVQTNLLCFLNDFPWDLSYGIDWWNLLGEFDPAAEIGILLQCRKMIAGSYGVTSINSVDVVENSQTRGAQVLFNASTIYTRSFSGAIQPMPQAA